MYPWNKGQLLLKKNYVSTFVSCLPTNYWHSGLFLFFIHEINYMRKTYTYANTHTHAHTHTHTRGGGGGGGGREQKHSILTSISKTVEMIQMLPMSYFQRCSTQSALLDVLLFFFFFKILSLETSNHN